MPSPPLDVIKIVIDTIIFLSDRLFGDKKSDQDKPKN